jgi:hypothetical protein
MVFNLEGIDLEDIKKVRDINAEEAREIYNNSEIVLNFSEEVINLCKNILQDSFIKLEDEKDPVKRILNYKTYFSISELNILDDSISLYDKSDGFIEEFIRIMEEKGLKIIKQPHKIDDYIILIDYYEESNDEITTLYRELTDGKVEIILNYFNEKIRQSAKRKEEKVYFYFGSLNKDKDRGIPPVTKNEFEKINKYYIQRGFIIYSNGFFSHESSKIELTIP